MKKILTIVLVFLLSVSCLFAGETKDRPSVALVLSGGGAKGVAHTAVLYTFEKLGIPIDKIFGTSMGSLIGGIYAAGYSPGDIIRVIENDDLAVMFTTIEASGYHELVEPFNFRRNNIVSINIGNGKVMGTNGLLDDWEIMNFLDRTVGNVPDNLDFDKDLTVPFECNAADMINGGEHIFRDGNLITAMRSSMSIPIAFSPVITDEGDVYTDGGMVSNMIVHRAIEEGYDIIFAVSLPVHPGTELNADNYRSFNGMVGGTLTVVLSNAMGDEASQATYHLPISMEGFGTMDFGKCEDILQRGFDEVDHYYDLFTDLASKFTEDQKEYKDPERIGEYFTKYADKERKYGESGFKRKQEKALENSRFGIGVTGPLNFIYDPKANEFISGKFKMVTMPSLYTSIFLKNIGDSRFSLMTDARVDIGLKTRINASVLYDCFSIAKEELYWTTSAYGEIGRFSSDTTPFNSYVENINEYMLGVSTGFNISNESTRNIVLKGGFDYLLTRTSLFDLNEEGIKGYYVGLRPFIELGSSFYSKMEGKAFEGGNARYDFIGGVNWINKHPGYKLGMYADQDIDLGGDSSMWVDASAYTSSETPDLYSSFQNYGGWDGIPGYIDNTLVRDYVMFGMGYEKQLSRGMVSKSIFLQIRGAFRSNCEFDYLKNLVDDGNVNWHSPEQKTGFDKRPFEELSWKNWDLGIGIGLGLDVQVLSDALVGIGVTVGGPNIGQVAVYCELR